jgi:NAD(P)H dehydrogenase (quinone)
MTDRTVVRPTVEEEGDSMIVVTGATGTLGRLVVDELLARVPAERIGVSVRDPAKARHLHERGVRVRAGDFADAGSLSSAFEGASQVLLVSAGTTGDTAMNLHATAIEAAVAAGAERIVYTSHMGADPTSAFPPMRDHAATEELLAGCGVAYTSLRNGFYTSTVEVLLKRSGALETGELAVPQDGPVAWTTHADLAEAAAIALVEAGFDGITPGLTASETVDMTEIAAISSELTGHAIRRVVVSDDDYRDALVARGAPAAAADMLVSLLTAARRGDFAPADSTLTRLLDRHPTTVREVLRANLQPIRCPPQ